MSEAERSRAEPTPRPWEFHKSPKVGHNIRDADGNVPGIARTYRDNGDAAHIVKCVNSYDAMREALEELVAEHDNTDDLPRSPDGHICGHKPDTFGIQLARQALEATDRGTG